ncbi:MAG TPA: hypothetical protein VMF13_09230, partial [Luteitalea sp.]|nr:hypothetical protein [Luteitalea sp.]
TNHLDLDSKDVLLDALEHFTGTLILVSHDRYFVDRLATKIVAVGHGGALVYPGTYEEYRWSQAQRATAAAAPAPKAPERTAAKSASKGAAPAVTSTASARPTTAPSAASTRPTAATPSTPVAAPQDRDERKRLEAEQRRVRRAWDAHQERVARVESRIAECEREIKELEVAMGQPGFYEDTGTSKPVLDRHQTLMWEVGDRMAEWEALVEAAPPTPS